jgi:hypothetical protein
VRQVLFDRPFIDGVVTDQPAYKLGPRNSRSAKDAVAPRGLITQRKGWEYDGSVADVADNLVALFRAPFALANVTRTLTCDDDGQVRIHNAAGSGTLLFTNGSTPMIPRAMYRDELLFCSTDGVAPLIRYSGASFGTALGYSGTITLAQGEASTGGTLSLSQSPGRGAYVSLARATSAQNFRMWHRTLEASTTSVTLENILAGAGGGGITAGGATVFQGFGYMFPCVPIYGAGSAEYLASVLSGFGTKWSSGAITFLTGDSGDAILIMPAGADAAAFAVNTVTDDDTLTVRGGTASNVAKSAYQMLRRGNFRDVANHKGSLWGAGDNFNEDRVYVAPPGWDMAGPPGFVPPYDPFAETTSDNADDFRLDYIEVPASFDGDKIVGITHSGDPLVTVKTRDAWGIYGSYPVFERVMLPNGAGCGCIDMRSLHTLSPGPVWAGVDDIHLFTGTDVQQLCEGKIGREWRSITGDFASGTDYCAIGEVDDHLIVSITSNGATAHVAKVLDLRTGAWVSNQFTNHKARYFFTSRVPGEVDKLLWVGDDEQGRVMNSAMVIEGGIAKDGDGTSPSFDVSTGEGLDGDEPIDTESRVLDVAISANLYEATLTGTTVEVSLISAGSLFEPAALTTVLGTITADTVDRPDRAFFDPVDQDGRTHQLRIRSTAIGQNVEGTKIEIPELTMTVRDLRSRT